MTVVNVTDNADVFTSNVYLVTGERTVLVDAGAMPGVEDVVAEHTDHLDAVVVTHQDADHVVELETVVERFDPDVYAYADHPTRTHAIEDSDELLVGDETVEVVYTPGHADDHVALVGETSLYSGDVVVYEDNAFSGGSFGKTDREDQDRDTEIESIQTLLARLPDTIETIYPGHGPSYTGDIKTVIERALSRARRHEPKYPDE